MTGTTIWSNRRRKRERKRIKRTMRRLLQPPSKPPNLFQEDDFFGTNARSSSFSSLKTYRRGRPYYWPSISHSCHPCQQRTHTSQIQERAEPSCQEKAKIRPGQEEGLQSESSVQGWSRRHRRTVRWRKERYQQGCQGH
jgi:hypothetical protein